MSEQDLTTKLLYAAGRGDVTAVRALLDKGVSVNACNHLGATALMSACSSYRTEMVAFLMQVGADVNMRTTDGQTALHSVVGSSPSLPEEQAKCVRLLLDQGADIDPQDKSGITPLMNAAWFGCLPSLPVLLECGASRTLKDNQGRTARDLALAKKRDEIVGILDN